MMIVKFSSAFAAILLIATASGVSAQTTEPQPLDRPVSWKRLLPNVINDQRRIWTFPARLQRKKDWVPAAIVLATTAALLALDPIEAGDFRRSSSFHTFNQVFSGNNTVIGTVVAPVSLYGIGMIRRDLKMQKTALLAGEAVADTEILTTFLKDSTKRLRPSAVPASGNLSDSWFEGGPVFNSKGSFPSGHTIAAFSVATVVARRYRDHRWVPYAAYGVAAVVGFSRLSLTTHFTSDVFMGGALGYAISRFAVLRE
jgi:membrane-associated phospholipid phosphatase